MRHGLLVAVVGAILGGRAYGQVADCAAKFDSLTALVAKDQAARRALEKATPAEREQGWPRIEAIDRENTSFLDAVLTTCGWPTSPRSSHETWLLVQHADHDLAFQRSVIPRLRASVAAGIGAPRDLAHLEDRVALASGAAQLYGTQIDSPSPCALELAKPVDDLRRVEERRKQLGLQPLAVYLAGAKARFLSPSCSAAK